MTRRVKIILFVSAAISFLLICFFLFFYHPAKFLEINFLDVGQGDAALIKTPYGQNILIDGGPSESVVLRQLSKNLPWFERKIDLVILTHPHEDHLAGLLGVLKRYQVKNIIYGSASSSSPVNKAWLLAIKNEQADLKKIGAQEKIILGDNCFLEIINPIIFYKSQDVNDYSLVSKLSCGGEALFTGDIGAGAEKALLEKTNFNFKADVLKVAHHGSAKSNSEEFLRAVDARLAIISVGQDNKYNLPAPEILRRLEKLGIKIFRTDKSGSLKIKSFGQSFVFP